MPSYALDGVNGTIFNETDYTEAQRVGVLGEGCNQYHENCTVSLFEVFRNILISDLTILKDNRFANVSAIFLTISVC